MEQLAIVIVSWNVCALLRACLASLYADLEGSTTEAEVWVVDNASDDGTPEIVAREFPRCRLIASTDNLGFVAGNNLALSRIQQGQDRVDAVWFLNPDTRVLPGATSALLHSLTLNEDVGLLAPGYSIRMVRSSTEPSDFLGCSSWRSSFTPCQHVCMTPLSMDGIPANSMLTTRPSPLITHWAPL